MARTRGASRTTPKDLVLSDGTVMIYGVVGDEWDDLTSEQVVAAIRQLDEDVERLNVLINSPGGDVAEGLAIYHELRTNPRPVDVEITGVAASMASVIALSGDTIRIAKNAMIMIHDPWQVAVGSAEELRRAAELLDQFGTSLVDIYVERTGLSEDDVREMMGEETWMDAETALAKGFVDEIIDIATDAEDFAHLDVSDFTAAPAALTQLIRKGRLMARTKQKNQEPAGPDPVDEPQEPTPEPTDEPQDGDVQARVEAEVAKREKQAQARREFARATATKFELGRDWADEHESLPEDEIRTKALDALAERGASGPTGNHAISITGDERDKFVDAAVDGVVARSGRGAVVAKREGRTLDPGPFQGMTLIDLARECLERSGMRTRQATRDQVIQAVFSAAKARRSQGPRADWQVTQTTSDFDVILENALHKLLLASYEMASVTWSRFCATGTVSDFKEHKRIRMSSLSKLDKKTEAGEFGFKNIPDGEKEGLTAEVFGNIIGITRETMINDDLDAFTRLGAMLGRAAAVTVEQAVFDLLAENSDAGPTMSDGNSLIDTTNHSNLLASAGSPTTALVESARVLMAKQTGVGSGDFLSLMPKVWLGPVGIGGQARVVNDAQYEVDASNPDSQVPNMVRGLFDDVVDTPRLSGNDWYIFADPDVAPAIEVAFLDGRAGPEIRQEDGFDYDGIRWRTLLDFGVAAIDWRAVVKAEE